MWNARAEYEDGTTVDRYFENNDSLTDNENQYRLECWLIERHPGCTWYSVDWIY